MKKSTCIILFCCMLLVFMPSKLSATQIFEGVDRSWMETSVDSEPTIGEITHNGIILRWWMYANGFNSCQVLSENYFV